MILCLAQLSPCWNDPVCGLEKVRRYATEAVEGDASFMVFPEQFLTGWNPADTSYAEYEDGEMVSCMRDIARDISIGLLGSLREKREEGICNTCIAIGPDGSVLARYAKVHLFSPAGEDRFFMAGTSPVHFTYDSFNIGIAICYDLRFGSLFHAYRDRGVDLMLVPSAWPASRMNHFHLFSKSRAAEFQTFVASVNTVGKTPVDTYSGGSLVAGPDGTVRAMGSDLEELIFCDINNEEAQVLRNEFPLYQDMKKSIF